ncbi:19053_t:CDS:2, partial [Cetraspora pellucida]
SKLSEIIKTSVKCKADKNKRGRSGMLIWNDYNENNNDGHRHFEARPVPDNIKKKWLIKVAKRGKKVNNDKDNKSPIKKKPKTNQSIILHYQSINKLTSQQSANITKALLKAFVYCRIPFAIIDNPYFRNFLRLLQPGYIPSYKDTLSSSVLDGEIV